jgi:hypothetical protein
MALRNYPRKLRFRKVIFRNRLYLSTHPYRIERGYQEGIEDMLSLARSARWEGMWLYSHDYSHWFNIVNKRLYSPGNESEPMACGVKGPSLNLGQLGSRVEHAHFHPGFFERKLIEHMVEGRVKVEGLGDGSMRTVAEARAGVYAAIPSEGDIVMFLEYLNKTSNCEVHFRVVSPHGVMSVELMDPRDSIVDSYRAAKNELLVNAMPREFKRLDPNSAIALGIENLNAHLEGRLTLSMEYRQHTSQIIN